jgi:hypothetical protein
VWYWSQKLEDLARVPHNSWVDYLQGKNPSYPETALNNDLALIQRRLAEIRADKTPPEKRLADNMLDLNPVATSALIQLTLGGWEPGRDGGLLNSRLRYFDPTRKRAGLPEDVGALVSEMTDTTAKVTLVNLNKGTARSVVVQGGAFGEHRIESVTLNGKTVPVHGKNFTVNLAAGAGGTLTLNMKRYALKPSEAFPWN